jgi:lambda family phage holin
MNRQKRNGFLRMLDNIKQFFDSMPPGVSSVLLAMFIAVTRVVYDGKETKPVRVILEAILCGLLTFIANAIITATGINPDWSVAAGGTIGFLGSMTVRGLALKLLENRAK